MHAPSDNPSVRTAVGATLAASVAFIALGVVTSSLGGRWMFMAAPSAVTMLAAFFVLFPDTRPFALLLTWNSLGLAIALLLVGIFSVGALVVFPLVLIVLALASWPRPSGTSVFSGAAMFAQGGGFLVILVILYFYQQQVS